MDQKLWAFWRYDSFPYTLGSKIEEVRNNGRVSAEGYGGMVFKPIIILPFEQGRSQWVEVEKLRVEYDKAKRELEKEFMRKIRSTIGFDPRDY